MIFVRIISPDEFPAAWLTLQPRQHRAAGNPGTKTKYEYKDVITAFDIETTRLPELEQSFMYVWQWSFANEYVVLGRTWEQFLRLVATIHKALKPDERLVVFVHNLSYEFSFLRGIHRFEASEVFAIKARKILHCRWGCLDFRCSYLHSNMSLAEYVSKMGAQWQKLEGFDYDAIRYPWTPLKEDEQAYCVHDVIALVDAVQREMQHDGDNLYTFPLTSTGYVRRDTKDAMRSENKYNWLHAQLPDLHIYDMLRESFRGGDTHASRFFSGQIVRNAHSADRSSSYPDIVCNCQFPVGPFFVEKEVLSKEKVLELIQVREKAVLMRVAISGITLADPLLPMPYLSTNKCRNLIKEQTDNGRVLSADYLETTITDVDLRILLREYKWTDIVFMEVAHARYGRLPDALINETIEYYRHKTELKNVEGQEVYYTKSKNKLNSIYGMMAQDPAKVRLLYTQDGVIDEWGQIDYYPEDHRKDKEQMLVESNKKAFLAYQWGVWVTAWARYRLREGIWLVIEQGGEPLYCDTDSVKYLGDVDWSGYNRQRIKDSTRSGAFADDPSGERHYMGVFEMEHDMVFFRTWGAKKYAYVEDRKGQLRLICTTAGVGKSLGAEELLAAGNGDPLKAVEAYKPGFVFHAAGGLEAIYNDETDELIQIDGHELHITPNVTLRPSTYELGLAGEYERLLRGYAANVLF